MQEEEAREPERRGSPAAPPRGGARPRRARGCRRSAARAAAADLGQRAVGVGVLGAGVAVAEVAGRGRSAAARRAARSRRPPPGARRSAPPSPPAGRAPSQLPRRRARTPRASVQAHGDERVLERGPAAVVGVDVAGRDAGDAEPLGERRQPAVAGRSRRQRGRCSSTRKRSRPKAPQQPRARAASARRARRAPSAGRAAPSPAQPERQTSPSSRSLKSPSASAGGGDRDQRRPGPGVRLGQQPAEVAPAGGVLDQQGQVEISGRDAPREPGALAGSPSTTVSSAPAIGLIPWPRHAWANSIAPQTSSWSVSAKAS